MLDRFEVTHRVANADRIAAAKTSNGYCRQNVLQSVRAFQCDLRNREHALFPSRITPEDLAIADKRADPVAGQLLFAREPAHPGFGPRLKHSTDGVVQVQQREIGSGLILE